MGHVLDYRTPANELRLMRIRQALRAREGVFWVKIVAMGAVGAVAGCLGPVVVAWVVGGLLSALEWPMLSGSDLLLASCLTVLPLLYGLEIRTRGSFLSEELQAQGTTGQDLYRSSSWGEWELRTTAVAYAVYIEVFLYGPRMVIGAVRQLRARLRVGSAPIARSAEIVMYLAAMDGGVSVDSLRRSESREDLGKALLYLQLQDWIDLGDHGRRVWLLSTARGRLPA